MTIYKEQGTQSLILSGCCHLFLNGQVGEEGFNIRDAHLLGMALMMKQDVAANPLHVGLLCTVGIVLEPNSLSNLVE